MTYDPFAPEVMADPAEAGRRLAGCPVHRFDGVEPPFWTLSHHRDVLSALRDPATFSSRFGQGMHYTEEHSMKSTPRCTRFSESWCARRSPPGRRPDGAAHRADRRRAPRRLRRAGRANLYQAFASPLPTIVIAEMLGVPARDTGRFKGWSDAWVAAMGSPDPKRSPPGSPRCASTSSNTSCDARSSRRVAAGFRRPDLGLVLAEEDGERLTAEDVVNVVRQLLVGGTRRPARSLPTHSFASLSVLRSSRHGRRPVPRREDRGGEFAL